MSEHFLQLGSDDNSEVYFLDELHGGCGMKDMRLSYGEAVRRAQEAVPADCAMTELAMWQEVRMMEDGELAVVTDWDVAFVHGWGGDRIEYPGWY